MNSISNSKKSKRAEYNKKYNEKNKLRRIYHNIKMRCTNPDNRTYCRSNIKMCLEWFESYKTFEEWAYENGYKDGLSIDRIDSFQSYNPSNCRFITLHENNIRRKRSSLFKKYNYLPKGVSIIKKTGMYKSQIHLNGKNINLGSYNTISEAKEAYDNFCINNNIEITK